MCLMKHAKGFFSSQKYILSMCLPVYISRELPQPARALHLMQPVHIFTSLLGFWEFAGGDVQGQAHCPVGLTSRISLSFTVTWYSGNSSWELPARSTPQFKRNSMLHLIISWQAPLYSGRMHWGSVTAAALIASFHCLPPRLLLSQSPAHTGQAAWHFPPLVLWEALRCCLQGLIFHYLHLLLLCLLQSGRCFCWMATLTT